MELQEKRQAQTFAPWVEVHLNCSQRKEKNTKLKEFNHKQMRCENEPNVSIGVAKTWRE